MKTIVKIIVFLILSAMIGLFIFFKFMDSLQWINETSKTSPNGSHTIYEFSYGSDSNRHVPYGTYLFLQKDKIIKEPRNGYVIFAGYCKNTIYYVWKSNSEITITCVIDEEANIRTISDKAYGIDISFTFKKS